MYLFVPIQAHSVKIFSSSRGLHSQWPPYSQANTIFWQTDENSQRYVFALFRQVSQRQPVLYLNLGSFLIAFLSEFPPFANILYVIQRCALYLGSGWAHSE